MRRSSSSKPRIPVRAFFASKTALSLAIEEIYTTTYNCQAPQKMMNSHQKSRSCSALPVESSFKQEEKNLDGVTCHAPVKTHRKKRSPKSATLLKKLLNTSAQIPFKARRKNQMSRHIFPPAPKGDGSGSDDDVSSFVASRSNSVMNTAPVLCPPIPAEYRSGSETEVMKSCETAQASEESYASHEQVVSEFTSLYVNTTNFTNLMSTLPEPEVVPWSEAEMDDDVHALVPSHPSDTSRCPYDEDVQFNSALSVFDSSRDEIPVGLLPVDTFNTVSDLQDEISGWAPAAKTVASRSTPTRSTRSKPKRNNSGGSSLILTGEVCFCPEEGILTLEANQSLQRAAWKSNSHCEVGNVSSKNSTIDDRIKKKKKKHHSWGSLFKSKESLRHRVSWPQSGKKQPIVSN